jgi:hypothetical protein
MHFELPKNILLQIRMIEILMNELKILARDIIFK